MRGTSRRFEVGRGAAPARQRPDISAEFQGDHRARVSRGEEGAEAPVSGRPRGAIPILLLGLPPCQASGRAGGEIWKQRAACPLLPAGPRGRCRAPREVPGPSFSQSSDLPPRRAPPLLWYLLHGL